MDCDEGQWSRDPFEYLLAGQIAEFHDEFSDFPVVKPLTPPDHVDIDESGSTYLPSHLHPPLEEDAIQGCSSDQSGSSIAGHRLRSALDSPAPLNPRRRVVPRFKFRLVKEPLPDETEDIRFPDNSSAGVTNDADVPGSVAVRKAPVRVLCSRFGGFVDALVCSFMLPAGLPPSQILSALTSTFTAASPTVRERNLRKACVIWKGPEVAAELSKLELILDKEVRAYSEIAWKKICVDEPKKIIQRSVVPAKPKRANNQGKTPDVLLNTKSPCGSSVVTTLVRDQYFFALPLNRKFMEKGPCVSTAKTSDPELPEEALDLSCPMTSKNWSNTTRRTSSAVLPPIVTRLRSLGEGQWFSLATTEETNEGPPLLARPVNHVTNEVPPVNRMSPASVAITSSGSPIVHGMNSTSYQRTQRIQSGMKRSISASQESKPAATKTGTTRRRIESVKPAHAKATATVGKKKSQPKKAAPTSSLKGKTDDTNLTSSSEPLSSDPDSPARKKEDVRTGPLVFPDLDMTEALCGANWTQRVKKPKK